MNDERARGFPAFPPTKARSVRGGSWWGNAWIQAMEDTALDVEQLRRGRRYARSGVVGPITVSPGLVTAAVQGVELYRTEVRLEPLSDAEWERFCDRVAARAGHIAALLDRDMPRDLIEAAEDAGVRLLPGIGDLEPECTCEGWELPCRHAAALCYQVAWLLDADPFVLLLLRGRAEQELLTQLQHRNAGQAAAEPSDVDIEALEFLVADAAGRAKSILAGETVPELDVWQDAVRLAACGADARITARLRRGAELSGQDFDRAVRAWGYGGLAALTVLREPWNPGRAELSRASTAFAEAWEQAPSVWRNWCSLGDAQLRLGRDERWYPYRRLHDEWWPAGPPHRAADSALAELSD